MLAVEPLQESDGCLVILRRIGIGPGKVGRRILGVEVGPLKSRWEKAIAEIILAGTGGSARIINGNEGRKLVVFRTQCVSRPRTEGRKPFHGKSGVHEILTLRMSARLRMQGVHEAKVVG